MNYLNPNKNPSGAYGNLQSYPVKGLLAFPDEFLPEFFKADKKCAGFVNIEDDGETVTACVWDEEAYQAYVVTLPEEAVEAVAEEPATLANLSTENTKLKAQLKLQSEQQTFLEDCILEMADVVYA